MMATRSKLIRGRLSFGLTSKWEGLQFCRPAMGSRRPREVSKSGCNIVNVCLKRLHNQRIGRK
uniref:Uncharacterized protein n=1 Tax=Octopus bimaculoides TaxID=37653 RepID=A0A0L8HCB2_OCTBM